MEHHEHQGLEQGSYYSPIMGNRLSRPSTSIFLYLIMRLNTRQLQLTLNLSWHLQYQRQKYEVTPNSWSGKSSKSMRPGMNTRVTTSVMWNPIQPSFFIRESNIFPVKRTERQMHWPELLPSCLSLNLSCCQFTSNPCLLLLQNESMIWPMQVQSGCTLLPITSASVKFWRMGNKYKLHIQAVQFTLINDQLCKWSFGESYLKRLTDLKTQYVLVELHEDVCSNHLGERTLVH